MSCSRITGICTVANEAQNGHSKSEYSVTSIGADSAPRLKPLNPSLAARGGRTLTTGAAAGARRAQHRYQSLGPLRPVDLVFVVAHASAFPTVRPTATTPPSPTTAPTV